MNSAHPIFLTFIFAISSVAIAQGSGKSQHPNTTGFFVSSIGHLLTQTDSESTQQVNFNQQTYLGKVIKRHASTGLTLLKIDAENTPFLTLANRPTIELGDPVYSIGFPDIIKSRSPRYSKGVVHSLSGEQDNKTYFHINASLNTGNNGAAVMNANNLVIGILSIQKNNPTTSYRIIRCNQAIELIELIPTTNRKKPSPTASIGQVRQATVPLLTPLSSKLETLVAEAVPRKKTNITPPQVIKPTPELEATPTKKAQPPPAPIQTQPILVKAIPIRDPALNHLTLEQQVVLFLRQYFTAISQGSMNQLSTMISQQKPDLHTLHQSYLDYWQIRKFSITNSYVKEAFFNQIEAVVDYQYTKTDHQGKVSKGTATNYFTLDNKEPGFKISTSRLIDHSPPKTQPEDIVGNRVRSIINQYMTEGSTGGRGASYLFADSIHYYGTRKSRAQAKIDEANYNRLWPKRYYQPSKPHEIKPIGNGRYYANAFSTICTSNGHTHRIIEIVSSFIIKPTSAVEHSIEKIWLASNKQRFVSDQEFAAFCRRCAQSR